MKIALSTYSLENMKRCGMKQEDMLEQARDLGFDAVEIVGLEPPEGMPEEEYAARLRKTAEKLKLPVSNYTFSSDLLRARSMEEEIARIQRQIQLAGILGAVSVRHDVTQGPLPGGQFISYEENLPLLAGACRRTAQYGQEQGIFVMTENHGTYSQDSSRIEKLLTAVHHPNFGLLLDIGNFLCADEDPVHAVGRLAPYARYVHVKDFIIRSGAWDEPGEGFLRTRGGNFIRGTIAGQGNVPVRQCLQILKNAGYDGVVALEFEGLEDPLTAVRIGLKNIRRYLERLY